MGRLFLITVIVFQSLNAAAQAMHQGTILQATKKLKMTSAEADAPKDFIVDLGSEDGVKVGDTLQVTRWISVINSWSDEPKDFLHLSLGEIQVSFVSGDTCIGRMTSHVESKDLPTMDNPWFMVGDAVQLKSSLPFHP